MNFCLECSTEIEVGFDYCVECEEAYQVYEQWCQEMAEAADEYEETVEWEYKDYLNDTQPTRPTLSELSDEEE